MQDIFDDMQDQPRKRDSVRRDSVGRDSVARCKRNTRGASTKRGPRHLLRSQAPGVPGRRCALPVAAGTRVHRLLECRPPCPCPLAPLPGLLLRSPKRAFLALPDCQALVDGPAHHDPEHPGPDLKRLLPQPVHAPDLRRPPPGLPSLPHSSCMRSREHCAHVRRPLLAHWCRLRWRFARAPPPRPARPSPAPPAALGAHEASPRRARSTARNKPSRRLFPRVMRTRRCVLFSLFPLLLCAAHLAPRTRKNPTASFHPPLRRGARGPATCSRCRVRRHAGVQACRQPVRQPDWLLADNVVVPARSGRRGTCTGALPEPQAFARVHLTAERPPVEAAAAPAPRVGGTRVGPEEVEHSS